MLVGDLKSSFTTFRILPPSNQSIEDLSRNLSPRQKRGKTCHSNGFTSLLLKSYFFVVTLLSEYFKLYN